MVEAPKKLMETNVILHFWEVTVMDRRLLSMTTATFIDQTIKKLKMLEKNEQKDKLPSM